MSAITGVSLLHAINYEDMDIEGPLTEANFKASASMEDGHAGVRKIDTTFENTTTAMINEPPVVNLGESNDTDKPWRNRRNPRRGQ